MMGEILIACEESQAVTIAFRDRGFNAFSCDIGPCSGGRPGWHIQGDVLPFLDRAWDMIIAFPPCTHLSVSGARWFKEKQADGRQQQGIDFFMAFANADCKKIAIENPIGIMSTVWRKPDQIIQPWQFGDPYRKSTCLWLKGLSKLKTTNIVEPVLVQYKRKNRPGYSTFSADYSSRKKGVLKRRSKTYTGIAQAMAEQWGYK